MCSADYLARQRIGMRNRHSSLDAETAWSIMWMEASGKAVDECETVPGGRKKGYLT